MQTLLFSAWCVVAAAPASDGAAPVYSADDLGTYFRQWLLCGPMALGDGLRGTDYKHGEQCAGFGRDWLVAAGGEAGVDPEAGQEVAVAGKTLQWTRYASKTDLIPLDELFTPNDLVVGYGFCKIRARRAGKYMLAVGSNDGVKVWLNGACVHVHHPREGRWLAPDDDYVPIELREGLNRLLVKVDEGTGDFGFVVRLLGYDQTVAAIRKNLDHHRRLSVVTKEDTARVWFGEPFAIGALDPSAKVTVELVDGAGRRRSVRSGPPGFRLDFPLGDVPDGRLTFRATFPVSGGETVTSQRGHHRGKLARHGRVKNLPGQAMLDAQGKPVLPIGMYSVPPSAYPTLKQAGMNFVVGSAAQLDAAHAAGLQVAVDLHGEGDDWIDRVRKKVADHRAHPGLLCWVMYDEPGYHKTDLLRMHDVYNAIYELDKVHPSYLVITRPEVYETFGRCCDVLAVDTYPVSRGDYGAVARWIERAYRISDGDQPVWHCGQLFAWPRDRPPTPQEHRYMTYGALIAGAKGFLWYAYGHRGWVIIDDDPPLWQSHLKIVRELRELSPVILAPGRGTRVELAEGGETIRAILKSDGKRRFLFAVNHGREGRVKATFPLPDGIGSAVRVYDGDDRKIGVKNNRLSDAFEPLGVHIYRLE